MISSLSRAYSSSMSHLVWDLLQGTAHLAQHSTVSFATTVEACMSARASSSSRSRCISKRTSTRTRMSLTIWNFTVLMLFCTAQPAFCQHVAYACARTQSQHAWSPGRTGTRRRRCHWRLAAPCCHRTQSGTHTPRAGSRPVRLRKSRSGAPSGT